MNIEALKINLVKQILAINDESLLLQIQELLQQNDDPVIGSTTAGEPLTRSGLKDKLDQSEADIAAGRVYTTE